jgi:adenosine deaminase
MLTPTTLTREYEEVERVFGWGTEDFLRTNLMAVDAAFVDDTVKATMREKLTAGYRAAVS